MSDLAPSTSPRGLRAGGPAAPRAADGELSSVRNALRLLKLFTQHEPERGVSELAHQLGIAKSTTHRLLSTLAAEGMVRRTGDGLYALGFTLWDLGTRMIQGLQLRELAHPVLVELRDQTGETAHLGVLEDLEVVYIDRVDSESMLRLFRKIGHRMPVHVTSTGKAILAFSPPATIDRALAAELKVFGPNSITSASVFHATLVSVREAGYAHSCDESERGASSVAAPVFDHLGSPVAAVSLAAPSARLAPSQVPETAQRVCAAAARISAALGYQRAADRVAAAEPRRAEY